MPPWSGSLALASSHRGAERLCLPAAAAQVLRDMQEDPASAQKHLAHPDIARKVEKLVAAGIVQMR